MKSKFQFILSLLPIVVFVVIEEFFGTQAGVIAGIIFGGGEVAYEYFKFGKVQKLTIGMNMLVVVLGALSLFEGDGAFFKLQPAILLFVFAGVLMVSSLLKKPLLVELVKKQRPDIPAVALDRMAGMNFRMGLCLVVIGAIGVYGAFFWSTGWWATYKAIGAPVLLGIYGFADVMVMRWRMRQKNAIKNSAGGPLRLAQVYSELSPEALRALRDEKLIESKISEFETYGREIMVQHGNFDYNELVKNAQKWRSVLQGESASSAKIAFDLLARCQHSSRVGIRFYEFEVLYKQWLAVACHDRQWDQK